MSAQCEDSRHADDHGSTIRDITHDLNNILHAMGGAAQMIQKESANSALGRYSATVVKGVEEARILVRKLESLAQ